MFLKFNLRHAAVVVNFHIILFETDSFGVICNRLFKFLKPEFRITAHIIGFGEIRIYLNRSIVIVNRGAGVAKQIVRSPSIIVGFNVI